MNKKNLKKIIPLSLISIVTFTFTFAHINQPKQDNQIKADIKKLTNEQTITFNNASHRLANLSIEKLKRKIIEQQNKNKLNSLDSIKKSEYYKIALEYLETQSFKEQLISIYIMSSQNKFDFKDLEKNTLKNKDVNNLLQKIEAYLHEKIENFDVDINQAQLNNLTLIFDDNNKNASISENDKNEAKEWFSTKFENHFKINNFKNEQLKKIRILLQQRKIHDQNILEIHKASFKEKIVINPTFKFINGLFVNHENIIFNSHKILNDEFVLRDKPNNYKNNHLSVSEIVNVSITTNIKDSEGKTETLENIGKTITINYQINYNNASIIDSKIYQNEQTTSLKNIYNSQINSYKTDLSKLNLEHNPESQYLNTIDSKSYEFKEQDFLIDPVPLDLPNFSTPLVTKFVGTNPHKVTDTKTIVPTTYSLSIPAHKFNIEHKNTMNLKEIQINEYNSPHVTKNVEFPINIINQVNENLTIIASKKGNKTLPIIVEKILKNISLEESRTNFKEKYFKIYSNFDFKNKFKLQIDNITKANNANGTLKLFYTISKRDTLLKGSFSKIVSEFLIIKYLDIKDSVDIDVNNTYDTIGGHGSTEKKLPNDKRFDIFAQAITNIEDKNPEIDEENKRTLIKAEYEKLLNDILLGGTFKKELIDNIKQDQERIQKNIEKLGIDSNSLAKFKELVKNNQFLIDLINKAQSFEDIKKAINLVQQLQKNFTLDQIKAIIKNANSVKKFISNIERYSLYVIGGFTLLSSILLLSISFKSLLKSKITKKNLLISKKTIFTVSFSLAIVSIATGSYAIIEAMGGINA